MAVLQGAVEARLVGATSGRRICRDAVASTVTLAGFGCRSLRAGDQRKVQATCPSHLHARSYAREARSRSTYCKIPPWR